MGFRRQSTQASSRAHFSKFVRGVSYGMFLAGMTYQEIADEVEKKEFAIGINYDPDGLSFDHELREHVAINKTFFDWMHSLAASGGIFESMH